MSFTAFISDILSVNSTGEACLPVGSLLKSYIYRDGLLIVMRKYFLLPLYFITWSMYRQTYTMEVLRRT